MRRVLQDGQTARPLQEKAIRTSWPQVSQRARAKPWARMPHSRKIRRERIFAQAPREGGESQGWDEQSASVRAPHAVVPASPTTRPDPARERSPGGLYPAVVIPVLTQHYPMLQRNLLYTALTRGRRLVVLVGQRKAIAIAVRNVSGCRRWTRLLQCLGGSMSSSQVDSVRQGG